MSASSSFYHISIVGLGLLGSSISARLKKAGTNAYITGISSPKTIKKALKLQLIDKGYEYHRINEAVAQSDLIVLCSPITHILEILNEWIVNAPE